METLFVMPTLFGKSPTTAKPTIRKTNRIFDEAIAVGSYSLINKSNAKKAKQCQHLQISLIANWNNHNQLITKSPPIAGQIKHKSELPCCTRLIF
jgi:hypothetical protein